MLHHILIWFALWYAVGLVVHCVRRAFQGEFLFWTDYIEAITLCAIVEPVFVMFWMLMHCGGLLGAILGSLAEAIDSDDFDFGK
jgi:Na+/proline symporter